MAKTFDNISEASTTNYLFLFAQRTLALQDEPPTPPPLNALGLPCKAICMLRDLMHPKDKASSTDKTASKQATTTSAAAEITLNLEASAEVEKAEASAETTEAAAETAVAAAQSEISLAMLKETTAQVTADKARLSTGSVTQGEEQLAIEPTLGKEATAAAETVAAAAAKGEAPGEVKAVTQSKATQDIVQLAKKITDYILDHQDDAAQEDRWRTTMKRETMKCFREQREAIARLDSRFDMQREAIEEVRQLVNDVCKNLATLANAKQD